MANSSWFAIYFVGFITKSPVSQETPQSWVNQRSWSLFLLMTLTKRLVPNINTNINACWFQHFKVERTQTMYSDGLVLLILNITSSSYFQNWTYYKNYTPSSKSVLKILIVMFYIFVILYHFSKWQWHLREYNLFYFPQTD